VTEPDRAGTKWAAGCALMPAGKRGRLGAKRDGLQPELGPQPRKLFRHALADYAQGAIFVL
jgi:hypothetical protein